MVLETLGGLVSNIAVIVILAVFVEMLLPNNDITKYLRLIMGLFIIVTILAPIMTLLEKEDSFEVATWNFAADNRQLESILKKGEDMGKSNIEKASQEYIKRIEGQIIALVRLIPEVDKVSAAIAVHSNEDVRFGSIKGVIIWAALSESEPLKEDLIPKIDPIDIDLSKISEEAEQPKEVVKNHHDINKIENQIRDTISSFYGLQKSQIQIKWN
ncbi:stage III sporulation protein AF [Desulfitibacter alkalitolerans]|uniref:stage III sporulation protein AF n=1 Tax=Desulfitibacter alkalitolerans TaxID=264641 RepID=UPI000483F994|nr:stage III sporulation protein AF [Desulfitibacter alkalitolerans]